VRHESQHLWQPTADEHTARNHLIEAYIQFFKYIFNPVLHANAALGVVYGLVLCMAKPMLLAWEV